MGWKKEVKEKLTVLERAIAYLIKREKERSAEESVLEREVKRLRKQNDLLLDRLMARDLTELKYANEVGEREEKLSVNYIPELDESLAGEVFASSERENENG